MPLFGLQLPLDEEERRRRVLTPGINPNLPPPVGLPNLPSPPSPRPLPAPGFPGEIPGGPIPGSMRPDAPLPPPRLAMPNVTPDATNAPLPEFRPRPITRAEELSGAKDEFMGKTPGRLKSGLLSALRGFASGVSTGGGLGAGAGGALAGGLYGAINPRGARERQFEMEEKPKIFERFGMEDQERAARMAAEKALREQQAAQAQIANVQSQIRSRQAVDALNQEKFDFESGKPITAGPGQSGFRLNRQTGQYEKVFDTPAPPRPADDTAQIEAALTDELGTIEEQSQGSLRGRLESLKQRLTPDEQRLVFGSATRDDDPQAVARAQAKWQKIQDDELGSIRRVTGEKRKAAVTQRRFGRKGQPGRTAISVKEAADLLR